MANTLASLRQIDVEQAEKSFVAIQEDNKIAAKTAGKGLGDQNFIEHVASSVRGFAEHARDMAVAHCYGSAFRQAQQDGMPVDPAYLEVVASNNPALKPKQAIAEALLMEADGMSIPSNNKADGFAKAISTERSV